jgi:hypothetical protein
MRSRILAGALLAALGQFVWGFVFWTTPLGLATMSHGADPDRTQAALDELFPADGAYFVPDLLGGDGDSDAAKQRWIERHRRGPLGMVFIHRRGADPMQPLTFVNGFLHMLITCVLIGWLLARAAPALAGWGARVGFVALAGFAATFWTHAGMPIWFFQPWRYHLLTMLYDLVAWIVAGTILARFAAPPAKAAT